MQTVTKPGQPIKIGTRGSPLALAQANEVKARLIAAHDLQTQDVEIEVISTAGDRILDRPLAEIGGKGLFTEEIEAKLLSGKIDLAVHSSKDMPTVLPDGLSLIAFLEREDPRDAFIGRSAKTLDALPQGAVVGTSSLRRQALVRRARPDITVVGFRGNVQTRLRKLNDGVADATLLAAAGLNRLDMADVATDFIDTSLFLPAPGQGAICIEGRSDDTRVLSLIEPLDHEATRAALTCERAFLETLDGSCRTPIAGLAEIAGGELSFRGTILTPDGTLSHDIADNGPVDAAREIGRRAGEAIRAKAGPGFFESWN